MLFSTCKIRSILASLGLLALTSFPLSAADLGSAINASVAPQIAGVSHEFNATVGYVAGAKAHIGDINFGNVTEQNSAFRYVASKEITDGSMLRLGVDWKRFSFGVQSSSAPLPNTLQSASLVMGADLELFDQWLVRMEVEPGVYSDFRDFSFDDVNAPLTAGCSYLIDENLQWFFGLSVDTRRNIPVFPAVGVRWKFADQWTLMFLLPKPRLEYALTDKMSLYVGGEFLGGTYKMAKDFGTLSGRQKLNNATVDFTEIRVGTGLSWKLISGITLDVDGGYMIYREFNYHTGDINVVNRNGAPYGQIALHAAF